MSAARRVELQLNVPGNTHQIRPPRSYALKRFDARDVRGHEVRQIELQRTALSAGAEQLRHLRCAQATSQTHDASIDFLDHTNPALHN